MSHNMPSFSGAKSGIRGIQDGKVKFWLCYRVALYSFPGKNQNDPIRSEGEVAI